MRYRLLLSVLLFSFSAHSQVYKFRALGFAFLKYNDVVADNPPWTPADILVTLDYDKEKITLYNKDDDNFDIATKVKKVTKGDMAIWAFGCLDKNGVTCNVTFLYDPSGNHEYSIMVEYSNQEYIYYMDKID